MVKYNVEIGTNKGGPQIAPFGREFCSLCNAYQFFMANHFHQLPTIFKGESPTPTWINQHKDGQFLLNILDKGKEIYTYNLLPTYVLLCGNHIYWFGKFSTVILKLFILLKVK